MSKFMNKAALLLAAACISTVPAIAQSTTQGAISGTVFDSTDAIVPKAIVTIHNDASGAEQTITSGDSGEFRAPQLAPGSYTLTFHAPGFNDQKVKGIIVQVNDVTEANTHLKTGETSTVVEVTADVPVIKFESGDFGGHLANNEIENIPINNRRWSSLALTTPAVTNDASGFGLLSFRAIASILNNVEIDGADDNQAFFSEERGRTRAGYSTSQAAVQEFQVNSGVYSAEFGRAVGGVVNSVTKSGGNTLHGEAYFYNRNSSRSAFQPFATNTNFVASNAPGSQYVTTPYRPKDNRNQIGFGAGGALIKDKLFWFYAFDTYRRNFPGTAKANNPAAFFINPDAAFTGSQACNTATGAITGTAATGVTPSTANGAACLLAARLGYTYTQAAAAYSTQLQAFLPNLGSVPRFGDQNINTPKLDWQITQKHKVSFLYHRLRWDSPGGVQTQGTNNYAIDTFGTDFVKLDYGVAKLDSLITSNLTNEIRYQYGRELNDEGNQKPSAYTLANLFTANGVAPEISLNQSVGFMFGQPYYGFRVAYPDERKWQIGDTATLVVGKHNIRFGEDIVHNYDLQNNVFEGNGFITYGSTVNYFSDLISKGKTCDSTGSGVGSAPSGSTGGYFPCYSSYAAGFGPSTFALATTDYGFFVQDDWKLTPRLTLNIGARYDYEAIPQPFAGISGTAGNTLAITSSHPSDKNNLSPRLGFAYDPFGKGKSVIRGGFGMYYGRIPNAVILNAYENTGSTLSQSTPSYTTANTAATALPTILAPPTGPAPGTRTAFYLDKHLGNPYTEQVDLTIQQDLGHSFVLSASYLGSFGKELPNYINYNIDPTQSYTINYNVVAGTNGSCGPVACGTYGVRAYAGKAQGATTGFGAIDPTFGSVTGIVSNINSSYNAASVDITKRSGKYATFDLNYTWAHALDYSQNSFTSASTNNWIDPYANPLNNYGNSSLNVPNRVVGWANFTLPGLHTNEIVKQATNGWSVKPLVQVQSGLPYSAVTSGTTPQQCYAAGCLTPVGTGIAGTSAATSYLPFLGRNTFTLPKTLVLDVRAQKEFSFRERYNLQFLAEAFNILNHDNITGVGTTGYAISTVKGNTQALTTNSLTFQPAFGAVSSANSNYAYSPRLIQIAARFVF